MPNEIIFVSSVPELGGSTPITNFPEMKLLFTCIAALLTLSAGNALAQADLSRLADHPRLLLPKGTEKKLLKQINRDAVWKEIHTATLGEADRIITLPVNERIKTGMRLLAVSRENLRRIFILSYAYRMTGQEKYLVRAEQEMLKANTPSDSIIVSKEAKSIAKCCKETSEDILPARTFMLTGPAGTGKSTTAAMVAHLCGLPFVRQGLGPDTDKFDLLISTQPNTANCASSINELCEKSGLPTLSDLQFDAVGYYNEKTGKTAIEKDGCVVVDGQLISMEEFVYMATEKWINTVLPISNNANQQFAFVHSPIVEAAQKGWVVEIQEPTLFNNPGELGLLNSLLEEGVITLPNGEIIRRHPDNIVIFTTNYGYEGTGSLNQALRDRCRKEYRINLPAEPELVERVMARSGNTNKEQVTEMVRFVGHLKKLQKEQLVGDGEIGERSLIAWAADSIRNDPYESCIEDVINKAASDSDDVKFFIDALDNSAFKKTRKRKR